MWTLQNSLILGDCLEVLPSIPDNSIDMILCDLPYGITNKRNGWDKIIPIEELWAQYERVAKENCPIVLHASMPFTALLVVSNIKLFKYEWVWRKTQGSNFLDANRKPLKNHESILVFCKGKPPYFPQMRTGFKPYSMTRRNDTTNYGKVKNLYQTTENTDGTRYPITVLDFPYDKEKLHRTQKPLDLAKYMIKTYTTEGQIVLDNACGSGTTLLAAKELNRNYIGIEKDKDIFDIACKRLGI